MFLPSYEGAVNAFKQRRYEGDTCREEYDGIAALLCEGTSHDDLECQVPGGRSLISRLRVIQEGRVWFPNDP
ncbi:hypothetical protein E2C01_022197 [Portunus trituberculatus]|uniref:Uncharacterized protein n=1 Tax=Portunus trituberculatus TaxID=210409 RepID=A0A5B7E4S6_PORTR|nr:hypothetical protein [Portunus trituberculatus]